MKKIITVFVALTFALSCFFTSCTNLADSFTPAESENASYSISGTITGLGFDGQKSESNSRTAFPDLSSVSSINYTITAVKTGASPVTATSTSSTPTFELKIPSAGIWTVKAEGFNAGSKKILSTIEYTVDISNLSPSAAVNLEAKPIVTEDGAGTISLSFGTSLLSLGITTVEVHGDDLGLDVMKLDCTRDGITTQTGKTLKSGSYVVDIDFYKTSGGNNDLCYSCTQVINVYDGLTTNTWVKHGNEPYLEYKTGGSQTPGSAADFKLTDALLKQFELSSFYVDTAANESGTGVLGSWLNPYDNFDDAYEAVETAFINGLKNATIFVKGKASDEYKVIVNKPIKNNASESLTIKSWDIEHRAVLTRGVGTDFEDDSFITNLCPLTLQNLILDGDNKLDGLGCIYTHNTTLELTNVEIRNFFAKNYESNPERCSKGGGIYIQDGNVTLNNVLIENCSVEYPSDYTPAGGAIYVAGGSLTITGETVIKDNYFAKKKTTASGTVLENGSKSNVYLKGTNVMSISNTGTGSRIGVTKAFASATANTVQFATDTTTALADKYFSDEGYLLTNVSDKANIARSSGTLTGGVYQDVKFEADKTDFETGEDGIITFTAKQGTEAIALTDWDATVIYAGMDVTSSLTNKSASVDNKSYSITFPDDFPAGNYYITISGKYNNLVYSGSQIITSVSPYLVDTFNELKAALADNTISSIKLTDDTSCTETLEVSRTVKISSANKSISCSNDYVFTAKSGANLTLKKITFGSGKAALKIESGGEVTLGAGTIVSPNGNVVPITTSGTLNIKDGAIIKDNTDQSTSKACGALYVSAGTVNMTGGEISNNVSNKDNVSLAGTVRINGSSAVFNMSGGTIKGNSAMTGSAFYVAQGTLNISGSAKITENISGSGNYGTVTLDNPNGRNPTVNMSGGEITGNICSYGKAGVQNDGGCFNMTGGCISGNGDSTNPGADFVLYADGHQTKFSGVGAENATIGNLYIQYGTTLDWNPGSVTIQNFEPGTSGKTYP